ARAIKRFLKNNPFAAAADAGQEATFWSNDAKAKRGGGGRPPWVYAVSLFPPAPAPLPYVVPSEVGHFRSPAQQTLYKRVLQNHISGSSRRDLRVHHSLRAPAIKNFTATHPFELYRPVNVVETEESLMDDSSREYNQWRKELAFEQAEAELERKRAESFQKQKLAGSIEKTEKYEPKEPRDVTWFKNREQDEITGNAKYIDETIAERQERRRVQEQMAQYEARNLKANNAST
ncbi:hypothetical protein BC829DRAFT_379365, partial [Chytridium lagenaria]